MLDRCGLNRNMEEEGSLYQGGWNRDRNVFGFFFHDGRTGGRILSENMECQTGCLAVCLPERECNRTLSAGENRIRTGVFIRDRSADHNENGTGSVPIEMENGGWDSCMTS